MRTRLTSEVINSRLSRKHYRLVGGAVSSHEKTEFACKYGHRWVSTPATVLHRENGCPYCSGKKLDYSEVWIRLEFSGIQLIGDFKSNRDKTKFRCAKGHEWIARLDSVLSGNRCPVCKNEIKVSADEVNDRLRGRPIALTGGYKGTNRKATFECFNGHEWKSVVSSVLHGCGCPHCSKYGYSTNRPASFYVIAVVGDDRSFTGFGVSNSIDSRLSVHYRNLARLGLRVERLYVVSGGGDKILAIEQAVKSEFEIICQPVCGFATEATHVDRYDSVVEFVGEQIEAFGAEL